MNSKRINKDLKIDLTSGRNNKRESGKTSMNITSERLFHNATNMHVKKELMKMERD
jgi:hypothetical protein